MALYPTVLFLHSWVRWLVVIAAIAAIVLFVTGGKQPWRKNEKIAGTVFIALVDVQLLLGFLLYFWLSPITTMFFQAPGAMMKTPEIRFWGVEHIFGMIVAAAFAHVFWARSKKRPTVEARRKTATIGVVVWLAIVLVTMPWPFMKYGRPLFKSSSLAPAASHYLSDATPAASITDHAS